ncbi:MAG: diaminopimelate decarboxylase [Rhodothermales bacterium]|nr:diaminopimelate decarboxylase [Rhodothermales bacterium]MBO6780493.1 diaminopimelate decarboxylase [Rhodothermales bacterium]
MHKPPPFPEILTRIARTCDTPTYVYFERSIRKQIERLHTALQAAPSRLLYAMKANGHPRVLKMFLDQGVGIDAVSPGELLLALRVGFPPGEVLFSANNMTDAEMHFAQAQGVLLNIGELSRLQRFGQAFPGCEVCVRINPLIGAGHHDHVITAGSLSKFGIPVDQLPAVREVVRQHDLQLVGLHQHIGSGIPDIDTLWSAVQVMLDAAREFAGLRFVNLGGGLGVPYRASEKPLDLSRFGERFGDSLRSFHRETGAEVWFEPGRYFVAEAGALVVSATTIKDNGDRCFVGVDSGMSHLVRPVMYNSYHEIVNLSNPNGPLRTYDVVGNICETGDTFARQREVAEIREGDALAILDVGAYGYVMASEYNLRPRPAEVWVPEDNPTRFEVITERQTPADMVAGILQRSL